MDFCYELNTINKKIRFLVIIKMQNLVYNNYWPLK